MTDLFNKINYCYGCGVCVIACPRNAISMIMSDEGFYIPVLKDEKKCIACKLCENVCSYFDKNDFLMPPEIKGFAGYSKETETRYKSTSGGIAFEIAKLLLNKDYKACGVKYNYYENRAEHFIADTINDFTESIGSKYIQSYTLPGFSKLTAKDRWVVFGTPCQIASLRKWAKEIKAEHNYFFVDFFCHGVPSYLLWNNYLNTKKKEFNQSKYEQINFRDKCNGWHNYTITLKAGKIEKSYSLKNNDLFYRFFLNNLCLNKACYEDCQFKHISSFADIRIGDMWGKKYESDQTGISAVLFITPKGRSLINELNISCVLKEEPLDIVTEGQMSDNLSTPARRQFVIKSLRNHASLKHLNLKIKFLNKFHAIFQ